MEGTLKNSFKSSFAFSLGILVVIGTASSIDWLQNQKTTFEVEKSHLVVETTKDILSQLKDAETGQRGYLITGEDNYLQPYNSAIANIGKNVKQLRQLTTDDPPQQQRIVFLESKISDKLAELKQTIELRNRKGFTAAQQVVLTNQGKLVMDEIRSLTGTIEKEEIQNYQKQSHQESLTTNIMASLGTFGSFMAFGLLSSAVLSINKDIKKQKQQQEELLQSYAPLKRLAESNIIGILVTDANGNIYEANDAFLGMLGYTRQDLQAQRLRPDEITPPEYHQITQRAIAQIKLSGICTPFEKEYIRQDGSRVPVLIGSASVQEYRYSNVCFVLDLSDQKATAAALQETSLKFQQLTENIREVFWMTDLNRQQVIYVSPAYEEIWGRSNEHIYNSVLSFSESIHPQDRDRVVRALSTQAEGRYKEEYRIVRPDGSLRWICDRAFPIRNSQQEVYRIAGIAEDITERKQLEETLRQQAEALEQANHLKDEFVAVVAHEIRTPLNAILGWSQILRNSQLNESTTAKALEVIERNAKSQVKIIDDLLDISRIIRGQIRLNSYPLDLVPVIEAALEMLSPSFEAKSVTIEVNLDPTVGKIQGDSDRLQQVVSNLVTNAIKFTPSGGRVTVTLERVNSIAQIQVRDTGIGISPEFLPYIFDRFRQADDTSSKTQNGLGLGLAIVRQLVEIQGGTVDAESPGEGLGAIFTVKLPLLDR